MEYCSVFNLFNFIPINDREKEIFSFDENVINEFRLKLDKDMFYLGGHIKMKHNEIINLDLIEKVKLIDKQREIEYGEPCNSFERESIFSNRKKLSIIENMLIKFNLIMEIRVKERLLESYSYNQI